MRDKRKALNAAFPDLSIYLICVVKPRLSVFYSAEELTADARFLLNLDQTRQNDQIDPLMEPIVLVNQFYFKGPRLSLLLGPGE